MAVGRRKREQQALLVATTSLPQSLGPAGSRPAGAFQTGVEGRPTDMP